MREGNKSGTGNQPELLIKIIFYLYFKSGKRQNKNQTSKLKTAVKKRVGSNAQAALDSFQQMLTMMMIAAAAHAQAHAADDVDVADENPINNK